MVLLRERKYYYYHCYKYMYKYMHHENLDVFSSLHRPSVSPLLNVSQQPKRLLDLVACCCFVVACCCLLLLVVDCCCLLLLVVDCCWLMLQVVDVFVALLLIVVAKKRETVVMITTVQSAGHSCCQTVRLLMSPWSSFLFLEPHAIFFPDVTISAASPKSSLYLRRIAV